MHSQLTLLLARARQQELLSAAASARRLRIADEPAPEPVVVRLATAEDRPALERLAALDCAGEPAGPTLIGELGQRPVAAVSLADGSTIADPFIASGDVLALLRLRARQVSAPRRGTFARRVFRGGLRAG